MITRQRVFEFLLDEDTPMEERVSQKAIFEKKLEEIVDKFVSTSKVRVKCIFGLSKSSA
jgi:hypothetical protein